MPTPTFVKNVVKTCLHIGKEDRVMISGWRHMLDLAEAFTIECRRAGAKTITEFVSDEIFYDNVLNAPLDYLGSVNPFDLSLADTATANIFIPGPEDPRKLKGISPERLSTMSHADRPFYDKFLENKVRTAQVMLGYVTHQRAKTYGFDYDTWKENLDSAIDVKYEDMQKLAKKLAKSLERGSEVHITTASGTDLRLNLEGRRPHVDDGIIDKEDIENGAIFTSLPSGSVQVAPTETSAQGLFVSNVPEPMYGILVHDATWNFKDGRLSSFKGGKNIAAATALWEREIGDKDRIGWITLGLNPKAKTGFTHSEIVLGTVTVGIGDNRELDGKNDSDYGCKFTATEPTVVLDGETIIKKGKFMI
ncbi:MAG TPA: aminopeptidase [Candidatus Acidoferrum sp.]|nr:aminopeptidase [Candidatus Acidoferrum sp.]